MNLIDQQWLGCINKYNGALHTHTHTLLEKAHIK